jgi:hypothetical protein
MKGTSTMTLAKPVLSEQDAERYAGKWVLRRKGMVVFSSTDVDEVRSARREKYDSIARVPSRPQVL